MVKETGLDIANRERDVAARERDAAARERDAAARERQAVASEAAQVENERERLAEEANSLEETRKLENENNEEDEREAPQEPTASQLLARAKKDLRAVVERHRRKHQRGVRVWRTFSIFLLHLVSLLIGFAIFVWKSKVFHSDSPPVSPTYRSDITFAAIILAVIFVFLLLEYTRNRRKHKRMLTQLDKIVVALTHHAGDLDAIRENLATALDDYDSSFL